MVGGYWPYWSAPPLHEVDAGYNTLYLFHAEPVGGPPGSTGAVHWRGPHDHQFAADLADWRARGGRALLTVGGERAQLVLDSRSKTEAFLESVRRIHRGLGGLDGLDWNNYEGMDEPPTTEMIRASLELKEEFGAEFSITTPPAPQSAADMAHCRAMLRAGALDLACPQFYGGPGLDRPLFIRDSVQAWVEGLGDPRVMGIGLHVGVATTDAGDGMPIHEAVDAWEQAALVVPELRGAYNWNVAADASAGWGFARVLGPRVAGAEPRLAPRGPALLPLIGSPRLSPSDAGALQGSVPSDDPGAARSWQSNSTALPESGTAGPGAGLTQ